MINKTEALPADAARLPGTWAIIDLTKKPDYRHGAHPGTQMYKDDPFDKLLKSLGWDGQIEVPLEFNHIPETSRFAISHDEIITSVCPAIAELLHVQPSQVRLPRAIEFNFLGNLDYLVGGGHYAQGNKKNGLANYTSQIKEADRDMFNRFDDIGFRPVIVFLDQPA